MLLDGQGRCLTTNRNGLAVMGMSEAQVLGKRLTDVFPEECRPVVDRAIEQVLAGAETRFEAVTIRPDGASVIWNARLNPVRNAAGEIRQFMGVFSDISQRRRTEEALRESELRFRTLVEQAGDGFELADAHGRFVDVNGASCRQLGYAKDELLRLSIPDIDPTVAVEAFAGQFRDLVGKPPVTFDTQHRRKDGTIFPVEVTTSVIRMGEGLYALALVRDITERKRSAEEKARLEARMQHAQKMESVGRLAGGVAHDFNNMLAVIMGHTEIALDHLDASHPIHGSLRQIEKAARHSTNLTRQLLAFARRQTVLPKVLNLNDTVGATLKMLHRLIGENIGLDWRPGDHLWPVKIDPTQVDQILANLCVNAKDAITSVGRLTIETGNTTIDRAACGDFPEAAPGDYVVLAVSDTGSGMSAAVLDRLFEPFFTTKEPGRGTGLGLATVYGIVTQNRGFVTVESEPGIGTTFRIHLPRHGGEMAETPSPGTGDSPAAHGETVLLVEDEPTILEVGAAMLQRLGYEVLTAATTEEAIRLARDHAGEIHLLLTDVVMPAMGGGDLVAQVVALRPRVKSLFMSGYPADVIAQQNVVGDGLPFLQKPFAMRDLAAKVRQVLDTPRSLP